MKENIECEDDNDSTASDCLIAEVQKFSSGKG